MRNCGRRGRSRNLMLAPNLLPKAVPQSGSRLLPGFIVRPDRRLVEDQPPLAHTAPRPSRPPERPGAELLTLAILASGLASAASATSGGSLLRTCAPTSLCCAPKASSTGASEP